jgi:hypothetical protein
MILNLAYSFDFDFKVNTGPAWSGRVRTSVSCTRLARLPLHHHHNEKKESMRRDVRILLVGDGTSFFYRGPCCQT